MDDKEIFNRARAAKNRKQKSLFVSFGPTVVKSR